MDMKEWIIIGGGALIGLIVLHGLFMAWWRGRDPLRMKIQPGLLPEDLSEDAWLSGELPNGGARVVTVDSSDAEMEDTVDAVEDIPVLLETADPVAADQADASSDSDPAGRAEESAAPVGKALPDMAPIVPERRLGSARQDVPTPSIRVEVKQDADSPDVDGTDPEEDEPSLEQAGPVDSALETMPEGAASFDDSNHGAGSEAGSSSQDAVDDLLVIHLVAPRGETFSGDALVSALRAQDLRYGEMDIFHRFDAATGEAVFSVVRAVEPGRFDLTRVEDCASPGLMVFLRLPGPNDGQEAFEDMMHTAEAMADELGGELLDENRNPFTELSAEGYRSRALGLAGQRVAQGSG